MRFPYFDDDLCAFAMRLPRRSFDKTEIRRMAASMLPQKLIQAPKLPQTVPIRDWFRGPLKEFLCDHLSRQRVEACGLFDSKAVQKLVQGHISGKAANEWKLWTILALQRWRELALARDLYPRNDSLRR